jgi:hypothetical protein
MTCSIDGGFSLRHMIHCIVKTCSRQAPFLACFEDVAVGSALYAAFVEAGWVLALIPEVTLVALGVGIVAAAGAAGWALYSCAHA